MYLLLFGAQTGPCRRRRRVVVVRTTKRRRSHSRDGAHGVELPTRHAVVFWAIATMTIIARRGLLLSSRLPAESPFVYKSPFTVAETRFTNL